MLCGNVLLLKVFGWNCFKLFQTNILNHTDFIPCLKNITLGILDDSVSSINYLILYGKRFIQQSKKYNKPLNLSNYIENLKLTLHKADPSTEPIVNLLKQNTRTLKFQTQMNTL